MDLRRAARFRTTIDIGMLQHVLQTTPEQLTLVQACRHIRTKVISEAYAPQTPSRDW
jgi:hypothetical protein